jgi:hypothetical protein
MLPAYQQPCIQSNKQTANTRSHTHLQDEVRADAGSLAGWPLDLGGRGEVGSWSSRADARVGVGAHPRPRRSGTSDVRGVERNAGHREPAGRSAFLLVAGGVMGPWAMFLRAWRPWAAALASSSRIGKWLPRHFARYDETWRNRQTLGWAMDGYRLTACAALRDVGDFG